MCVGVLCVRVGCAVCACCVCVCRDMSPVCVPWRAMCAMYNMYRRATPKQEQRREKRSERLDEWRNGTSWEATDVTTGGEAYGEAVKP